MTIETVAKQIQLGDLTIANDRPFTLLGGVNVLEDLDFALHCAGHYKTVCKALNIPLVFKASYDKANRSSIHSFRGPGLEKGLEILQAVKDTHGIPVITDVHSPDEAAEAAKVADIIQLPRLPGPSNRSGQGHGRNRRRDQHQEAAVPQPGTDAQHRRQIPRMRQRTTAAVRAGTNFGYDNLVVDMLGFGVMKRTCDELPLIFDVTHALQCRDPGGAASGGRRTQVVDLARSAWLLAWQACSSKPIPIQARPVAMAQAPSLDLLEPFLSQVKAVDDLVKALPVLTIQ